MRKIFVILICLLAFKSHAQTANAGADQTIYLSSTSTATLDGSASTGSTFSWSEISTDYMSGATITSPTSATTTVTGLKQGVFYFKLTVDGTAVDTTIVTVLYDAHLPGTFLHGLLFSNPTFYNYVNDRTDQTQLTSSPASLSVSGDDYILDRCRSNSMFVDGKKGKFYSIIEDGYHWQNSTSYARTEVSYGTDGMPLDTAVTYEIDWSGYFPQGWSTLATNQTVGVIMQIHGLDGNSPPFGLCALDGYDGGNTHAGTAGYKGLYFTDQYNPGNNPAINDSVFYNICPLDSLVNKTHSLRILLKEGSGTGSFIKVYWDGVLKYKRENNGQIGATLQQDYLKFSTLYDYGNALVDPNNTTRGRVFKLATNSFNVYSNTDTTTTSTSAPTVTTSGDQPITDTSTTVFSTPVPASGHAITSYSWTQLSGGTYSITSPSSQNTGLTALSVGTHVFQIEVTQDDAQTATATVTITVSEPAAPTVAAGADQSITTSTATLTGSNTWASGYSGTLTWTEEVGAACTITSPNSATTTVTGLTTGEYRFKLTGNQNDDFHQVATDTVHVTVTIAAPTANAGTDQTITLPTSSATLSGSGTVASGQTASYLWTKVSGSGTQTITGNTTLTPTVSGMTSAGDYVLQLKVTQTDGQFATDTVTIHVNTAPNPQITTIKHTNPHIYININ